MSEQLIEMGLRLTTLREIRGLSAAQVAEKLDMDESEYVAFERGEKDFSYSFMSNVSSILEVDILSLISGSTPKLSSCAIVKKDQGVYVKKENAYLYKYLAYTFKDKIGEPVLVEVMPSDPYRFHTHEGQEFNYILSGKMRFYIGEEYYDLSKGDCVYFDSGIPHAERAMGEKQLKFLAVVMKRPAK